MKKDFGVVVAVDGLEAVKLVKKELELGNTFSFILLDGQMPKMSGLECARALRDTVGYKGVIFGCTGNTEQEDIDEFTKHGADHVFTKPISRAVFNDKLSHFGILE